MLRSFEAQHHALYIFTKESGTNCATAGEALNLFEILAPHGEKLITRHSI